MSVFLKKRAGLKVPTPENFADASWAQVIEACRNDEVPATWNVGDSLTMDIGGTAYVIDIIGKDHDDYSDGSGKAPLTFQMQDCYTTEYAMNGSDTNSGSWGSCAMRNTHLPAIKALMPAEVQAALKKVNKKTSAGSQSSTINTTEDDLFLLSEIEIFGSVTYSKSGEGTQYAYYSAGNYTAKNLNGTGNSWWERSPQGDNSGRFCCVHSVGDAIGRGYASISYGVAFAFCF